MSDRRAYFEYLRKNGIFASFVPVEEYLALRDVEDVARVAAQLQSDFAASISRGALRRHLAALDATRAALLASPAGSATQPVAEEPK